MFNLPQQQPNDKPQGGPIYTVKLVGDDEPYQPDMVKPFTLPQGNRKINLHFNSKGILIGFQVVGGDRPTVVGPDGDSDNKVDPVEKYGLDPNDDLFPEFKSLLQMLRKRDQQL